MGAFFEETGAESIELCASDLELVGGIREVDEALMKLLENLLKEQVGEALGELLFL